jgi:cation diffusion facilitator CzcD-associated flavoprotein CzcO
MTTTHRVRIGIIGSGFSGLCMGIRLKEAGYHDFVILEKADDLGGTWRDNTYPGAACDIPSALYSYSFENSVFHEAYSGQKVLLDYLRCMADTHNITPHIRYGKHVVHAQFDRNQWRIKTKDGSLYLCQFMVSAVGQLHHPHVPDIQGGAGLFQGHSFHTAQWDHSVETQGKRIGIVGSAASAVQAIPELVRVASHLEVYQRSPNYVCPRLVGEYSPWIRRVVNTFPVLHRMYRWSLWCLGEYLILPAIQGHVFQSVVLKAICTLNLMWNIRDTKLREILTPNYPVCAKRMLFSSNYYPALMRDNVCVNTKGIKRIDATGISDMADNHTPLDIIVYATGFRANQLLCDMKIIGRNDLTLEETWSDRAHAYLGVATHGFPNFFFLYGPNTNLGHSSVLLMIEPQVELIIRAFNYMKEKGTAVIEVQKSVEEAFVKEVDRRAQQLAFTKVDSSWYLVNGKLSCNWIGGVAEYERRMKAVDWGQEFEFGT